MAKPAKKSSPRPAAPAAPPAAAASLPVIPRLPTPLFAAIAIFLAAATILIYAQTAFHEFINYDDPNYLITNSNVNRGLTLGGIVWALRTFDFYYWQPLTWISHMIDCQLFGLKPGGHHVVSLFFHAVNAVLLQWALFRLSGNFGRSCFAAGLFALHPLRVESVAWAAERKDVLSGLFWILTMLAYAAYVRHSTRRNYWLVFAAFLAAVMSKPSVVTLPFVLLLLDYWPLKRLRAVADLRPLLREKLALFAVIAASSLWTFFGQQKIGATVSLKALPFWFRTWNAATSYVDYLASFVWPAKLGVLYPYDKIPAAEFVTSLLLLAALSGFVLWRARQSGYLLTGWLWFLGAMVPMIGLAQSGLQARADRFTYLPMIGLAIVVSWGLAEVLRQVPLPFRFGAAGLLLGVLTFVSFLQTTHWKNSFTLFEHTIRVTQDNDVMHLNLAGLYQERNELDKAIPHFEAALRIEPTNGEAHFLVGGLLMRKGDYLAAIEHFRKVLELDAARVDARKQLAEAYFVLQRKAEAMREYQIILQQVPSDFEARSRLMMMNTP